MAERRDRTAGILRAGGTLLVGLGLVVLLFLLYELVGTTQITRGHQSALRAEFRRELAAGGRGPATAAPAGSVALAARAAPDPIARLVIPKISVDAIVVDGVSRADLTYGPGWYPETAPIGTPGTAAIAGHRTTWGGPFFDLDHLAAGDTIVAETGSGSLVYRVTGTAVVDPGESWVLDGDPSSTASSRLVLTTCAPRFSARYRLVVWADLLRTTPLERSNA